MEQKDHIILIGLELTYHVTILQECWKNHQRKYPHNLEREIDEFHMHCSARWYDLNEAEKKRFQEMADKQNTGDTSSVRREDRFRS